ncbi:histidine--tRNA ligase [Clostridium sp. CAG:780]|nr:histidine--tRNA ligase [Clostridium sp. CAG:780]
MAKTEPRTLPGFMELLPNEQILFDQMKQAIEESYRTFGFLPIDTPIIELADVLLAKTGGETAKQIYKFEKGDTNLALRFDLTVPLAKYVAKNYGNLSFPFRRYQIGKVYRGEKVQKGRYREFYQCDIDIIGDETLDIINDAELPVVIATTFSNLGFNDFTIKINNRKILNGLYESLGQEENSVEIMRIVDKLDKIGVEAVKEEISKLGVSSEVTDKIIEFIQIKGSTDEILQKLEALNISNEKYLKGVEELKEVVKYIRLFKMPEENFAIDLTIARGLDYYTGTVYETFLNDYRELGSVCSGGRYENLAENYTDKKLPGVGVSIGLTRLFYKLNELNIIKADKKSISDILIIPMTENMSVPLELGTELRKLKVNTEIYLNNKKIKAKMKYADKLEIPYVVVIGDNEIETSKVKVKEMATGKETECELDAKEILNVIRRK